MSFIAEDAGHAQRMMVYRLSREFAARGLALATEAREKMAAGDLYHAHQLLGASLELNRCSERLLALGAEL